MYGARSEAPRWLLPMLLLLLLRVVATQAQSAEGNVCPTESEILPCRCTMRDQDLQIWCSHSDLPKVLAGLRAVGGRLTRPVDELILENNNLPSLPGGVFSSLRVVRLMLRDNGLERVATSWLAGLEDSLLELFLVEPHLRNLPPDSLEQLNGLEAVTIQGGAMKRMPRFSGHPRLRYIQIQSPSLVELSPQGFKNLPDLDELHIVLSPRLMRLEAGLLHDLPRLRLLNMTDCGVSWIHPRAFARLPLLSELTLSGNLLSDAGMVGRALRDLSALSVLHLNNNQIDRLGEASFVDLRTLREINLKNNRISELQRGAFHLVPALRKLDLSNNRVRRVHPESFLQQSDSGVEEIWLVNNELDHIGELRALLDSLPRLRYLDMSYNYIQEIPFGALHGHPTLERLHLDHNRIQHVQREAFMAMPALRELRLKNNSLSTIMEGPMWNLPGLKGLDLSFNVFRRLDPRLLGNLPSLRRLDLSGNALTLVDPDSFLITPSLEHVNLSGNALVSFHPSTFHHLRGLYELDVGWNQLRELVPGLPRGLEYLHMPRNQVTTLPVSPSPDLKLPSLKLLDLSGNGISRISPGTLSSLSQLRTLNLGENAMQQLEDGTLEGLSRLEVLDLHDNRLLRIHGKSFNEIKHLRELDLNSNRIETLQPELLRGTTQLRKLDLSRNQLVSIPPNALANTKDLEKLDASRNALTHFPEALHGLTKLHTLNLSNNRLKQVSAATLNSLASLSELRLAKNKLQELLEGTFSNLPQLTLLDLDSNELEVMASRSVQSLPNLRAIRLSHNRLPALPEGAFSNLPELLSAELQSNQLSNIAGNAFKEVPQLVMLNLSYNQLERLDHAGIQNLKSLEILDLSHNKMVRIGGSSLVGMEGLVELKMDDNRICTVHGSPFSGMGRLRVLSLRNNRMVSLPEPAFQPLRSNVAILDVAGNPLSCSCTMLWLQAWLRESTDEGPRCADGSLLKEMRLSRQECQTRSETIVAVPGCEAITSGPGSSQVLSTWMEVKNNSQTSLLPPSPEESEYFYDEYVEYPLEEGGNVTSNNSALVSTEASSKVETTTPATFTNGVSSHYIPGDTPTLYAGVRLHNNKTSLELPKKNQQNATPPRGGLTFFGYPLSSINIGGLWGPGAGRKSDSKPGQVRFIGARGKVQMLPPTTPNMEQGFQPMVPESGGFTPIINPQLQWDDSNQTRGTYSNTERQLKFNYTTWVHPENDTEGIPTGNERKHVVVNPRDPVAITGRARLPHTQQPDVPEAIHPIHPTGSVGRLGLPKPDVHTATNDLEQLTLPFNKLGTKTIESSSNGHLSHVRNSHLTTTSNKPYPVNARVVETKHNAEPTLRPDLIEANDVLDTTTELNNSTLGPDSWSSSWFGPSSPEMNSEDVSTPVTTEMAVSTSSLLGDLWGMISAGGSQSLSQSPSSLSALLVPGGQQPQFRNPGGKPTITKVTISPAILDGPVPMEEYLRRTQPNTITRSANDPPNYISDATVKESSKNDTLDWYYRNYNQTNLPPYVGPGRRSIKSQAFVTKSSILTLFMVLLPLCTIAM